MMHHAEG